ncbi:putative transmembrane protein [Rhizoctonia solani 123E]|uniref:Putative transmembrane protein n=1 Tax=Rhizoctonia solani 123E TaxID=1423351 RepID=A0A074RMN7_9AGAM|nr:putative transmembrane protein [Rhizoctonia solani 123E]
MVWVSQHRHLSRYAPCASRKPRTITNPAENCQIVEPQEFDKPGEELGKDARVWELYVRETSQEDREFIDGWNRTTDVTLSEYYFLLFLIETSKSLRQYPANEVLGHPDATSLMTNGTQAAQDVNPITNALGPSRAIVIINALWFLSLILSVAVSFVAMLSKEWFFGFMRDRTGSPAAQARRRQLRWEKFQQWRVEEALAALPAVIHIALRRPFYIFRLHLVIDGPLVLFSGGLCVFLWELNSPAVAIPVTIVVALMITFCVFFTIIGPALDNFCPYSTTTFRMYNTLLRKDPQAIPDELCQDDAAKILHSMIKSRNPQFVDLAVQSLSAAKDTGIPVGLLEEWDAWTLVWSRFQSLLPYNLQFDNTASLYARAFLALEELNYNGVDRRNIQPEKACLLLWAMQGYVRQRDQHRIIQAGMRQEALQLGRVVVHHCLEALKHSSQPQNSNGPRDNHPEPIHHGNLGLIEHVTSLLERPDILGCNDAYGDICLGFTALLCCSPSYCPPSTLFPFIKRSMNAQPPGLKCTPEFALALGAYAFSRYDYPYLSDSIQTQKHIPRVERALSVVWHYVSGAGGYPEELAVLGLRYLEAHLDGEDRRDVSRALNRYSRPTNSLRPETGIHTLPPAFVVYNQLPNSSRII